MRGPGDIAMMAIAHAEAATKAAANAERLTRQLLLDEAVRRDIAFARAMDGRSSADDMLRRIAIGLTPLPLFAYWRICAQFRSILSEVA